MKNLSYCDLDMKESYLTMLIATYHSSKASVCVQYTVQPFVLALASCVFT